jgi:hypothetical protein
VIDEREGVSVIDPLAALASSLNGWSAAITVMLSSKASDRILL